MRGAYGEAFSYADNISELNFSDNILSPDGSYQQDAPFDALSAPPDSQIQVLDDLVSGASSINAFASDVANSQGAISDALGTPSASQVQVLDDLSSSASDEGHAMMQIVHDVALDASLTSFTGDNSEQGFANGTFVTNVASVQDIASDALSTQLGSAWQSLMASSDSPLSEPTSISAGGEGTASYHPAANLQVDAPTVSADVAAMPAAAAEASTAAPADLPILGNPVAGPFEVPITNTSIGSNGATPAQVQQALDESGLSVNGTGITIGVISDSFNELGGAAADEADGALPPASQVNVLQEDPYSGGTDEGRAMMQIVHDVAPGASLDFYSGEGSQQAFANGILALAAAGCKVICDDITYYAEPFFQTGVIAQAIQTVEQEGVTYLTCAGNQANAACQSTWTSIASIPYGGTTLTNTENFGSNSPVQTVSTGGTVYNVDEPFILQWNQPFGATTANLEVLVFLNGSLYATATNTSSGQPNNPDIQLNLPLGYTFQIAVENLNSSSTNPTLIKDMVYNDYSNVNVSISGENAGTVYGHHMSPYAITVGAASTANTPAFGVSPATSESFSSSGLNTQLWFNYNGTPVSGGPLDLSPVAVTGVDNINTTVSGGLTDFYGTSAATPSVAGVVALMLQANPNLTPTQIDQILQASTTSMANPAVSGAGLVQANVAVTDAYVSYVSVSSSLSIVNGQTGLGDAVQSGGILNVLSGGTASGSTVNSGGTEIVAAGGTIGNGGGGTGVPVNADETFINGGTLVLQNGALLGANIEFEGSGGLLQINGTTTPSLINSPVSNNYVIQGFSLGNTIDLAGVPYSSAGTVTFNTSTDVLQVTENSNTYYLQLDSNAIPAAGNTFALVPDTTGGTEIVEAVSVAYFNTNETSLNTITGGIAISDTAANVYANLAGLATDASHISSITATGGQVIVGNGLFVADKAALNKIVGGFTIVGQASVLQGNLSGLEADISHINSITGLNGTITATVAQFLSDDAALNEVIGGFAVSDTAANVYANLAALAADASHIASITATGGQVTVGYGLFAADQAALNEIVGGFTIVGQAPVLSGNLNSLEADISHINSITGLNGTITATAAQFLADQPALGKIIGGYNLDVTTNGATNISSVGTPSGGPVGLIFDGTTAQNITMTTQEYNDFSTITDGVGTTAANCTITFTNSGTVTASSNVDNYILAATGDTLDNATGDMLTITGGTSTLGAAGGGDAITIGTAGTLALGTHTGADTITFGSATSTGGVTGWVYTSDILKVSAIGTGVVAATPADLTFSSGSTDALSMGHVNFVTDSAHAGNEVAFYTTLNNYSHAKGHLDTGTTSAKTILIVNDGTHAVDDVFYVVGNGNHGATSVTLIGTYDVATAHFTATLLA